MSVVQQSNEIGNLVREAYGSATPIYPIGGGTVVGFGAPIRHQGIELSLAEHNQVIDYPSRDMTITVEAGVTMQTLAATLVAERQRIPVDAPQADRATIGGMVATGFSGARRYGHGTIRDYVIGISAVDGRGTAFKAGGRVVKNVAGYDFCKLLCGSLGTLAVVTQVTLKVKPMPEADAFLIASPRSDDELAQRLAALAVSPVLPAAIEVLAGDGWAAPLAGEAGGVGKIIVGLEGTLPEVDWMVAQLVADWRESGFDEPRIVREPAETSILWNTLTESMSARSDNALVVKCTMRPSAVAGFIEWLRRTDPQATIHAHAGNGVVIVAIPQAPAIGAAKWLIQQLRPATHAAGGHAIVWSAAAPEELTPHATWGGATTATAVMQSVKQQFDPKNLLNRGRYFFA